LVPAVPLKPGGSNAGRGLPEKPAKDTMDWDTKGYPEPVKQDLRNRKLLHPGGDHRGEHRPESVAYSQTEPAFRNTATEPLEPRRAPGGQRVFGVPAEPGPGRHSEQHHKNQNKPGLGRQMPGSIGVRTFRFRRRRMI